MRASSQLLWLFTALVIPASCVLKGWLTDANGAEYISELTAFRQTLDQPLDSARGVRVLIAGGSNAASSYDSSAITEATGVPTFNLGLLDEGLHFSNVFGIVEERARAGDIVILSSLRFLVPQSHGGNLRQVAFGRDRWRLPTGSLPIEFGTFEGWIPFAPLFGETTLIRSLLIFKQWHELPEAAATDSESAHLRTFPHVVFDSRGDWANCTESTRPTPLNFSSELHEKSKAYLAALKAFAQRLGARGVQLRLTIPSVLIKEADRDRWDSEMQALLAEDHGAEFLPFDVNQHLSSDRSKFCDTYAHLLRSQAATNSEPVIQAIQTMRASRRS